MQTMGFITWLFGDVSLTQLLAGGGISGATLWGGYKWFVGNQMDTLKLRVETQFRYREIEEERRNKFQADIMGMVAQMKVENDLLRAKLFESENTRLELMQQIGSLQIEIASLKQEIMKLTAELSQRGAHHAIDR